MKLSRDLFLLLASMALASIPVGYLQVVLPLYLNRAGLEPALIGLLYSLSGLVTAALVAFSGTLADRFGRRWFLVWGTALPIVSYAIFATITQLPIREESSTSSALGASPSDKNKSWFPRRSIGVIVRYGTALGLFGLGLGVAVQLLPLWFKLRFGADEAILGPWYAAAQVLS